MVIELGTPHATCLPDTTRRFGLASAPPECSCPSKLAVSSGRMRSIEARSCSISSIQSWNHLGNSLFCLTLGFIGSVGRPIEINGLLRSVELGFLTGEAKSELLKSDGRRLHGLTQ